MHMPFSCLFHDACIHLFDRLRITPISEALEYLLWASLGKMRGGSSCVLTSLRHGKLSKRTDMLLV